MKSPILIGIAGGSGAGKSTLAFGLKDSLPDKVTIIHFDDYQKKRADAPVFDGMTNWDHPGAIDFEKLILDLKKILNGESVSIQTRNERDNPEFPKTRERKEVVLQSLPIIILEGYLCLYDKRVRDLLDYSVYLDIPHETRIARRTKSVDENYVSSILIPMHQQFVEPTKNFADLVIDVSNLSAENVLRKVLEKIPTK